ncbi:MAG: hypothetical protein GXP45_02660 [bacterium]|nr:hypothetical protein [bacterium]
MANTNAKEYVLALLSAFEGQRALAKGLKVLVQNSQIDDKMIDGLAQIFQALVQKAKTQKDQETYQKAIDFLDKVKLNELKKQVQEGMDLDELLNDI